MEVDAASTGSGDFRARVSGQFPRIIPSANQCGALLGPVDRIVPHDERGSQMIAVGFMVTITLSVVLLFSSAANR